MIIQITNRCHMGCKHCMQDSRSNGRHMTEKTIAQVMSFVKEAKPLVVSVSGGEPTEHPLWDRVVAELLRIKDIAIVTVLTNGAWIDDKNVRLKMAKLIRESKGRFKVQVYSHPDYYKDHEWTVEHKQQFLSIGCTPDFYSPIFMQDLGRARKNCQDEVAESTHVPSCINSHMIALQTTSLQGFMAAAAQAGKFCRPLIDPDGNIHMSESWLCQSVAHISDGVDAAFRKMQKSRPCKACRLYKNFVERHPVEMQILEK